MYSTHTARGEDCQVERVGEIVRGHESNGPTLLAGDFNMPERSTVLAGLKNKAGFLDAFRIANPTSDGPTVWQRITSPQPTVSRRVDFIRFLNGRKSTATVRSGRIVLDRPGTLPDGSVLWPSDHYGVLAELEIHPAVQPISLRPCAKNRFP